MSERRIRQYFSLFRHLQKLKKQMNLFFILSLCMAVMSSLLFELNMGIVIFTGIAVTLYLLYWIGISSRMEDKPVLALRAEQIRDMACSLVCMGITVQAVIYYKENIQKQSPTLFIMALLSAYILFLILCWLNYGRKINYGSIDISVRALMKRMKRSVPLEVLGIFLTLAITIILFQENVGQTFMEPPMILFSTGSSFVLILLSAEAAGLYKNITAGKPVMAKGKEQGKEKRKAETKGSEMLHLSK